MKPKSRAYLGVVLTTLGIVGLLIVFNTADVHSRFTINVTILYISLLLALLIAIGGYIVLLDTFND